MKRMMKRMTYPTTTQMRVLVIRTNSEGRPCGWGLSGPGGKITPLGAKNRAKEEAERAFRAHRCYVGEKPGRLIVHWMDIKEEDE